MRFLVARKPFLEAITLAGSVAPSRSSKPILQDLKITATPEGVVVVGTDLEVGVSTRLKCGNDEDGEAVVKEPGTVVVSATKLQAIVRELSSERLEIKADGRTTLIASQDGDFRLFGDDPAEFPILPEFQPLDFLEVGAPDLAALIERVELAAARELGRYAVNGALLTWDGETITSVATDGRRLAMAKHAIKAINVPARQAIVPLKGLAMFRKSLAGSNETVGLRLDGALVALRTSRAEVTARVLEGEFPDFQEVLAQQQGHKAGVAREELLAAIRRASVVLGSDSRSVRLSFRAGTLEVSAREEGSGEAKARVALEYQGPPQDVSVNPEFMMEFLKLPTAEHVQISFDQSESPVFCRPDENYLYVVMPIEGS